MAASSTQVTGVHVTLQMPTVKRKVIRNNVGNMDAENTRVVFQLEHVDAGISRFDCMTIGDLVRCAAREDCVYPLVRGEHFGLGVTASTCKFVCRGFCFGCSTQRRVGDSRSK